MLEKPKGDRAIRREKIEYDRVIRKKLLIPDHV